MENGNKNLVMKIINNYTQYYIEDFLYNVKEVVDITNFIKQNFPSKFEIKIKTANKYIYFDLEGNFNETKVKSLNRRFFENDFLIKISTFFNLEIRQAINIEKNDNLILHHNGKNLAIAFKTFENQNFLIIYYLDLPDLYRGAGDFKGGLFVFCIIEFDDYENNIGNVSDLLV